MTSAAYAILAVFGTFFLLIIVAAVVGFIYFAVQLVSTIRAVTKAIEMVGPLLKGEELTRLSNAFILMGKQGAEMLRKMEALDKTIGMFYKFAMTNAETMSRVSSDLPASDVQAAGGGRFIASSDEKAAAREAAEVQKEQERIG